ncbi:MAG: hypothetical protein U1A78_01880 [Polyangia bacterium]
MAEWRARTLAPLAHVLLLSLLLLPTLTLMPDERSYLVGALVGLLALIIGHGALAPLLLRRQRGARRLALGLLLLAAPLPLVGFLCGLAVPALRFRLGLVELTPTEPSVPTVSLTTSGLLVCLALAFWFHELKARAEFE